MKNIIKIFAVIFLFLTPFFAIKAYSAITFDISSTTSQISQDEELGMDVALTGLSQDTKYYLQTRIKPTTGNNYFGFTKDSNDNWYKYSGSLTPDEIQSKFFSFTTDQNGSWNGKVLSKIDTDDTNYKESGDYILQVLRYTGNSKSESSISNDFDFTVNDTRPTATPTPFPTNTPAPTSRPTTVPTIAPTAKSQNTVYPTISIYKANADLQNREGGSDSATPHALSDKNGEVLGSETNQNKNTNDPKEISKKTSYNWGKLAIIMGAVLISFACGILIYQKYRAEKEEDI